MNNLDSIFKNPKPKKISSLHDDVMVPKSTGHFGEYKNHPNRFDPSEKSVITRIEQFGANIGDIEEVFGKKVSELTQEEYGAIMAEMIRGQYDVIVASVFDLHTFPAQDPDKEPPKDSERLKTMLQLIKQFEGMDARCGVNLVKNKKEFGPNSNIVLALEAGAHLIKSVGDARELVTKGIKIFGLQYGGEDNAILTTSHGLTEMGYDIVRYFLNENLIVDLAHANLKPRKDIIALAKDLGKGHLISYTHGCAEEDIIDSWKGRVGERALKQSEIEEIIKMGGIIGLGVSKPFFDNTRKLAERIDSIAQLENGIDSIAIGTDFGGVAPEWLNEIKKPEDFKILCDILAGDFGMKDEDIDKVVRANVKKWIQKAIN